GAKAGRRPDAQEVVHELPVRGPTPRRIGRQDRLVRSVPRSRRKDQTAQSDARRSQSTDPWAQGSSQPRVHGAEVRLMMLMTCGSASSTDRKRPGYFEARRSAIVRAEVRPSIEASTS